MSEQSKRGDEASGEAVAVVKCLQHGCELHVCGCGGPRAPINETRQPTLSPNIEAQTEAVMDFFKNYLVNKHSTDGIRKCVYDLLTANAGEQAARPACTVAEVLAEGASLPGGREAAQDTGAGGDAGWIERAAEELFKVCKEELEASLSFNTYEGIIRKHAPAPGSTVPYSVYSECFHEIQDIQQALDDVCGKYLREGTTENMTRVERIRWMGGEIARITNAPASLGEAPFYPTPWAYEQACRVLNEKRQEIAELSRVSAGMAEALKKLIHASEFAGIPNKVEHMAMADALEPARRALSQYEQAATDNSTMGDNFAESWKRYVREQAAKGETGKDTEHLNKSNPQYVPYPGSQEEVKPPPPAVDVEALATECMKNISEYILNIPADKWSRVKRVLRDTLKKAVGK